MSTKKYEVGAVERARELGYSDNHWMRLTACSVCGRLQWIRLGDDRLEDWECLYCRREEKRNREVKE